MFAPLRSNIHVRNDQHNLCAETARVNGAATESTDGVCGPASACADRSARTQRLDLVRAPYADSVPDARLAIAHVTPYPWGAGHHEITTLRRADDGRAGRARPPGPDRRAVALQRGGARDASGAERRRATIPPACCPSPARRHACSRSATRCPTCRAATPRAGAAGRRLAHDREPADDPAARRLPRARAVRAVDVERRAAPLARAERRHVPPADRARCCRPRSRARSSSSCSAASTRARRASAPRASSCSASFPPTTACCCPAPTRRRRASPRPTAAACASASSTTRSGPRCACSCARCGAWTRTLPWEATIVSRARSVEQRAAARRARGARALRDARTSSARPSCSRRSDVFVAASDGASPAPGLLLRALNAGAVPLASRLPVYEEALGEGELRAAVRAARHRHARRPAGAAGRPTRRCASGCRRPPRRCARS